MIHQIDECCWIKDAWPVTAHGVGGRIVDSADCSQNLDSYSIEYTFADGTKALVTGRYIPNCFNDFVTYRPRHEVRRAVLRQHPRADLADLQGSAGRRQQRRLETETERVNPWQAEWNVLLDAIRNNKPHNEARRAAYSNLAAIMGRAAVHTGKVITWDEMMASKYKACAERVGLTNDSPAPIRADAAGRYPAPIPGACTEI